MVDWALTVEASPSSDVAGIVMREDEASSRETSSHDGVREGDGGLKLDQGNVITGDTHTFRFIIDLIFPVMFTERIFLICSKVSQFIAKYFLFSFYRMNKEFHFSCTMMLAVPMNTASFSVSIRLCFPMATLYSLPVLQVAREKDMKQ